MTRVRLGILAALVVGGLIGLSILGRQRDPLTPDQLEAAIKSYWARDLLASYDLPTFQFDDERVDVVYLKHCVQLANTKYGKHLKGLVFNPESLDPDFVNLVFIKEDPDGRFRDFRANCAYTGHKNTIICDLRYLHQLTGIDEDEYAQSDHPPEQDKPQRSEMDFSAAVKGFKACTALWVLGHEIGHLAHGHDSRHFLFSDENPNRLIKNSDGQPIGESYTAEQEADNFAFEVFEQSDEIRGYSYFMWMGVSQCVATLANKQLREQGEETDSVTGIEMRKYILRSTSRTHPPTFLRASVIGQRLAEDLGNDNTGHFRRIVDHIEVRK